MTQEQGSRGQSQESQGMSVQMARESLKRQGDNARYGFLPATELEKASTPISQQTKSIRLERMHPRLETNGGEVYIPLGIPKSAVETMASIEEQAKEVDVLS